MSDLLGNPFFDLFDRLSIRRPRWKQPGPLFHNVFVAPVCTCLACTCLVQPQGRQRWSIVKGGSGNQRMPQETDDRREVVS